jgi:hypothetical protein
MRAMSSRRIFVLGAVLGFTQTAQAQQSSSPLVGRWTGHVPGLGAAEIVVLAIRANGQVEGRMVFQEPEKTLLFGDKLDIVKGISHGVAKGAELTIETAMGGTYRLSLVGAQLSGEYVRGTTYKVPVTFQKRT